MWHNHISVLKNTKRIVNFPWSRHIWRGRGLETESCLSPTEMKTSCFTLLPGRSAEQELWHNNELLQELCALMWRWRKKKKRRERRREKTLKAFGITPTAFPVRLNFNPVNRAFTAPVLFAEYHRKTLFSGPVCTIIILISTPKTTVKKEWIGKTNTRDSRAEVGWVWTATVARVSSWAHGEVTAALTARRFSPSVLWKYECQLIFSRGPSAHF